MDCLPKAHNAKLEGRPSRHSLHTRHRGQGQSLALYIPQLTSQSRWETWCRRLTPTCPPAYSSSEYSDARSIGMHVA